MIRQTEFTAASNEVSIRYNHFLEMLLAAYNRTILRADVSTRAIEAFKRETANILKVYLEREVDETVKLHDKLTAMVEEDTANLPVKVLADEEWLAHLADNTNFLYEAIKLQAAKDVLYVTNFLRSKVISLQSLNRRQAAYNLVYGHSDLGFYYTDKLGRKINSTKYVRTVTRDYMVKTYNDLLVGVALLNGIPNLTIDNTDEEHKDSGRVVAVSSSDELNYFAIRDAIFHPNTNSIVRLP